MPAILERLVELIRIKIPDLFSPVDDILRERKASHTWPVSSDINIHPSLNISNETHFLARSIQCQVCQVKTLEENDLRMNIKEQTKYLPTTL